MGTEPPKENPAKIEKESNRISRMTLGPHKVLPLYDSTGKSGVDKAADYSDTIPDHESRDPGSWSETDKALFRDRLTIEELALSVKTEINDPDMDRVFAWVSWAVDIIRELEGIDRDAKVARELMERLAVEAVHDPGFLILRLMYLSPETSSIEDVISRSVEAGKKLSQKVTKQCVNKWFIHYAAKHPEWIPFLCPQSEKVHRLREQMESGSEEP